VLDAGEAAGDLAQHVGPLLDLGRSRTRRGLISIAWLSHGHHFGMPSLRCHSRTVREVWEHLPSSPNVPRMLTVLAGGVGAARLLAGLVLVHPAADLTAVVNVGDDVVLHGLHISPDLDTVTYTLAGAIDPERGWGLAGETWQAMATLGRYGGAAWFNLGDRDLGTHLFRTQRLDEGATLTEVTAEIARGWDLELGLLPATDDALRTRVTVLDPDPAAPGATIEREVGFQEYFVQRQHGVPVTAVRFDGAASARPGPEVVTSITGAEAVVIAPSNPLVSIGPVLAVPGIREAVEARRERTVAVSPIIAGAALKGPADRMLRELGHESTVVGVARLYAPLAATLVIDEADAASAAAVEAEGLRCVVAPTVMHGPTEAAALGRTVLAAVGVGGAP
jgi:LPPG:FO 2-phospho-L-lactate transferase